MSISDFYSTASQISFTLLGFWWAVVQFRYDDWTGNPARRRLAHVVSLLFLLPGVMSLLSMLTGDAPILWRLSFGLAGVLGLAATLLIVTGTPAEGAGRWFWPGALFVAAPLYALVTLFAIWPEFGPDWLGLQPLQLEGILLSLLVFLGVNLAWSLLWEGKRKAELS
ncbi:MAG: hypothetical protein QOH93_3587 [Chloroflexia bacterium]|nr:hypothetical protein [Chloroflexia bacterium]